MNNGQQPQLPAPPPYPVSAPVGGHPGHYLLPVHPGHPHPYFVPIHPAHGHPHFPGHPHLGYRAFPPPPYPQYIHPSFHNRMLQMQQAQHALAMKNNQRNKSMTKRRKRIFPRNRNRMIKTDDMSDDIIIKTDDISDEHGNNNNNSMRDNKNGIAITDKSPFKTTYISFDEEIELKNTNNTLYSQFHHARQAIYQQYQQKVDTIRHSNNIMDPEKRKLQIKIAAIDAKVQEKKLFLSYLEMSKPQPNSWLISNSTLAMNSFARKIATQQQTPVSYPINNNTNNTNDQNSLPPAPIPTNPTESDAGNVNGNLTVNASQTGLTIETDIKPEINNMAPVQIMKKPASAKRVKKPKFSEYNVRVLRDWYETHTNNPYPSSSEKHLMCQLTGLTKYQVSRWFCNVRTRKPPPELSDNDEDLVSNQVEEAHNMPHIKSNTNSSPIINSHYHHQAPGIIPPPPPPINMNMNTPMSMVGTPMNMPPITPIPITPTHHHPHFNFTPMNHLPPMTPINNNSNINNQQKPANDNLIDTSDNTEGLMPPIQSNFINNPPPLIDENSNHIGAKK